MQPKNMLEFAKSVSAPRQESSQAEQAEQPGQPGQPGQTPTVEQPKSMLEFAKSLVNTKPLTQDQGTAKESAVEDPNAWKKEARAGHFERVSMRAAEALGGMPGEMVQSLAAPLGHYVSKGIQAVTGKEVPEEALTGAASVLPTSEDIKKFHEKYTGEYYRPQTPGQARADEIVQDTVRVGLPMLASGGTSAMTNALRIAGVVGAGQGSKEVAKRLGYGEEGQEYAKMGAQIITSMINPGLGKNLAKAHYDEVNKLPETYKGNSDPLRRALLEDMRWAKSLGDTADKAFIRQQLQPLMNKIEKNPRLSFQEAREYLRSLNQNASSLYDMPSSARKVARARVDAIRGKFDNFLKQADKHQPGWYGHLKAGNEIHGALEGSRKFADYVGRNKGKLLNAGISSVVLDSITGLSTKAYGTAGLAGAAALYHPVRIAAQMNRSPLLRNAYLKAGASYAAGNIPQMTASLKKMDKEIRKEDQ